MTRRNPSPVGRERVWLSSGCTLPVDLLVKQARIVLIRFLLDWLLQGAAGARRLPPLRGRHLGPCKVTSDSYRDTYFLFFLQCLLLLLLLFATNPLILAAWGLRAVHRPQLVEADKEEILSVLQHHCKKTYIDKQDNDYKWGRECFRYLFVFCGTPPRTLFSLHFEWVFKVLSLSRRL